MKDRHNTDSNDEETIYSAYSTDRIVRNDHLKSSSNVTSISCTAREFDQNDHQSKSSLSPSVSPNQQTTSSHHKKAHCSTTHLNQSESHSNGELCDRIRHFTEELKEKFIKKHTNRSLFKKSESTNSSDQEEDRKCVTRIKINTNDVDFFANNTDLALSSTNLTSILATSTGHIQTVNQSSLTESRSPFINRALPPLPSKERNYHEQSRNSFNSRASNSRSDERFVERLSDHKSKDSNNRKFNKTSKFDRSNDTQSTDEDEDSELNIINCFKINFHNKDLKNKSKNLRNQLLPSTAKKYSHPPPHLHSRPKDFSQQFDYDEDENNGNQVNTQSSVSQSSLINLNVSLIRGCSRGEDEPLSSIANATNETVDHSTAESTKLQSNDEQTRRMMDYAESIEKVKDQGWYWGPLSGEKAEKLLENEPEGSFIVRDSSDENYIFSLTFKLNSDIVHVRIEHDQGNFSFGSLQKFSSSTIVDFIREAVEYSRSGRYLFFLHRLPVVGPLRVQLLNPVSRFRNVQSLKHLSRFIILKHVRRDLIATLPLPDKLIKYLNEHNYFAEMN